VTLPVVAGTIAVSVAYLLFPQRSVKADWPT